MPDYTLVVNTTGSAGSATGSKTTPALESGQVLEAIKVDYHGSAPATTDLVVSEVGGLQQTLLTLTNTNTDGIYYPRHALHDAVGAEGSGLDLFQVEGQLQVAVSGCDALAPAVTVTLRTLSGAQVR